MSGLKIDNMYQAAVNKIAKPEQNDAGDFGSIIKGAIGRVDGMEQEADKSIVDLLKGKADIHETMIALQKSDISMRLLLSIRGKALDAYREIMRMQF